MMMSWFFLLSLLVSFLVLIFLLQNHKKPSKKRSDPPGPPGLPLIGNLHQFSPVNPQEFLWRLSEKYGPLLSLKLGSVRVLVISSAEMAKETLKDNDMAFSGRPSLVCTQKLSYNGKDVGFSPYGDYWREMKKLTIIHLLSFKKVQSFRPIHEDEITQLVNHISTLSSSSETIELRSTFVSLTSRIICRIAFGKKGDTEGRGRRSAHQILRDTETLLAGFYVSDYFPYLWWVDKLRGIMYRLEENFKELDSFYDELIEEHLNPYRPETKNNILDMLIKLKEEPASGAQLTWNHIKAMLTNIFIASTESSASTIIYTMISLMKNPATMKRLQTEIRDLFGNKTNVEAEKLRQLPYLNAVIKETLRLCIPAPLLLPRKTIESCTIGDFEIKPDTVVLVNAWAIARDPKTWEDPEEFKPERFLNRNIDVIKGQNFELIPFGSGRRGCPGAYLAFATVELVIANLMNFFDWELPSGMNITDIGTEAAPGLTMLPEDPIRVQAKRRA